MCAWPLNFIYVMCATVKHVTDSDIHMFCLLLFFFFLFLCFFFFFSTLDSEILRFIL